jgi:hypothetical protein
MEEKVFGGGFSLVRGCMVELVLLLSGEPETLVVPASVEQVSLAIFMSPVPGASARVAIL